MRRARVAVAKSLEVAAFKSLTLLVVVAAAAVELRGGGGPEKDGFSLLLLFLVEVVASLKFVLLQSPSLMAAGREERAVWRLIARDLMPFSSCSTSEGGGGSEEPGVRKSTLEHTLAMASEACSSKSHQSTRDCGGEGVEEAACATGTRPSPLKMGPAAAAAVFVDEDHPPLHDDVDVEGADCRSSSRG